MNIACEKCKYNDDGECVFYYMGSGNEIDMPCYREKELISAEQESTTKNDLGVDAVSRAEVMEQCQEWRNLEFVKMTNPYYYLEKRLNNLSSVTPQEPKWIPVSERLPENKTYVLTTIHVPGRQPHARSGWYDDGLFMNDNGDTWKSSDIEVIAWMPLPKPYSEVEQ